MVEASLLAANDGTTTAQITLPADYPPVARVEVAVVDAQGTSGPVMVATAVSASRHAAPIAQPAGGGRLFVRVVHADGTVIESGVEDFRMP